MQKAVPSFEYVKLPDERLNIVDMISLVGRAAIPATLFYDVDATWAEMIRETLSNAGHRVTITALLIKAIAIAQRNHPTSRTQMLPNGKLVQFNNIEAQFTVERFINDQPGLFFGSIKQPDTKSLIDITEELRIYGSEPIEKVPQLEIEHRFSKYPRWLRQVILFFGMRYPSIRLRYMGATFGLSSLGKYGARNVISPSVITSMFCIGEVERRPKVVGDTITISPQLSIVLNFDHRVIDGAAAARFMADIIGLLEGGLETYIADEIGFNGSNQSTRDGSLTSTK
ncbi:MAG TPA: 2-oxo acid dehydrogenase subunit E2 [Planktothrix sp.]|jgi:pyruvate/2-oxoglutarate dehydrogenase complex dihydrolipoamide acyltransferase (E2) component